MFFISDALIESLLSEDMPLTDVTTAALGIGDRLGAVECFPRRACVVAGVEEAARVFEAAGAHAGVITRSGSAAGAGEVILTARGAAENLHAAYKTAQNIMEYSSGIATRCAEMVRNARRASPEVEVSVTRKHFPGTKALSLKAAIAGGASIHRTGLSDSVLIFDQHRIFTESAEEFSALVRKMPRRLPEKKIAAEAGNDDDALFLARLGVDVIQCERFEPGALARLVPRIREINPGVKITAAGGVRADNAFDYAATGADALVTSWVYFGAPEDIKMKFSAE
jgi:molybdenum transport protein